MTKSSLIRFTCLTALVSLASCAAPTSDPTPGAGGNNGTAGTGGSNATAGTGGSNATAGTGGSNATAGTGGSNATGGTAGSISPAGTGGSAGTTGAAGRGGTTGTAGTTSTAGTGGGAAGRGGTTGTAGATSTAGTTGSAGATGTGGTGIRVDQMGVPLAKVGDMTTMSKGYLNLGDMRLINNRWGSDELGSGCGTTQRVYINSDRTIGWDFNRPVCGGAKAKPDYPEVEFGVAPFGAGSPLLTTPSFSTTTLLPKQIKDITQGSVRVDTLGITLAKPNIWNINFEMWLSQQNPLTSTNPVVYAEIIVFWGWETGRWPCQPAELSKPPFTAGTGNTLQLCHQADVWGPAGGQQWRFYQFNLTTGPVTSYSGTIDARVLTEWVVTNFGLSRDLWVTRYEIGSEIDDNTQGTVKIKNLTFSVNNTAKSIELQP